ncbi:MAG: hypothetical protein ACO1RT_14930 [Planctomycetaceae bacterium]
MIAPLEPPIGRVEVSERIDEAIRDQYIHDASRWPGGPKVEALQRQLTGLIARHPVVAVAAAAALGLTMGWVTKRRR